MPLFMTTNLLIAIVVLVLLAIGGAIELFGRFGSKRRGGVGFSVFEVDSEKKSLDVLLGVIAPPFAFEVAVDQIGKVPKLYLVVPASKAKKVSRELGAKEVGDYDLYNPGGVHLGAYLKGSGSISDVEIDKIDFTEVNEIGEGAVVQFVFNKKSRGILEANVRVLISAPSQYQAKEILARIKSSIPAFKLIEVKSADFMQYVDSRLFNSKESLELTV